MSEFGTSIVRLAIGAAFVAGTGIASAQALPVPLRGERMGEGVTEQGRGVVRVPAQRLVAEIQMYGAPVAGLPASAASSADADIARVVDAMRANGVPDAHESDRVFGNISNGPAIVRGTVANPTREKIAEIEKRTAAAVPPDILARLRNLNVTGVLEVDDCSAARDSARAAAYAQARSRAESLAKIAGERIGALISAEETDNDAGCGDEPQVTAANLYDAAQERTDIAVAVSVRATFALLSP